MDEWVEAVSGSLGVASPGDVDALLDVARDIAHNVERRATPVTTYLVGVAVGAGMSQEDAVERVRALVQGWSAGS